MQLTEMWCGVYSRAAFINILALRCGVYSRKYGTYICYLVLLPTISCTNLIRSQALNCEQQLAQLCNTKEYGIYSYNTRTFNIY